MKLQKENFHPRDEHIEFEEETHTYTVKGDSNFVSVTSFIHDFFPKFDADSIIDKMMSSSNWPNSKYFGMTKDEIIEMWDKKKELAASQGTQMHKNIEDFYNDLSVNDYSKEFKMFLDFHEDHRNLKPFRTEWCVYDENLKLAGSIDMVFENNGSLIICDWKRSREIRESNRYEGGLYPLSHLPHANYWHYSLQLNIYRAILEKNYGVKVESLLLVCLHPNNDFYQKIEVPLMEDEVLKLFELRAEDVEKKFNLLEISQ